MSEGQPQPVPQEIISPPEAGSTEGLGNLISSLVEQQAVSRYENEEDKYDSRETRVSNLLMDLGVTVSEVWHPIVRDVSLGYNALVYDKLPAIKQARFLTEARRYQQERGGTDLVLTEEEGKILKDITQKLDIAYDPGTATSPEKRTFSLAALESKAPEASAIPREYRSRYFTKGNTQ